jgi:hypothetical protein
MKKIDLSQAVQLLANVGVIAGILFLAFEVRQNNDFLQADAEYRIFEHRTNFRRQLYEDATLASLVVKSGSSASLTVEERVRLSALYSVLYAGMSWEFRQYEAGRADDYPLETIRQTISTNEFSRQVWADFIQDLPEASLFLSVH